MIISKIIIYLLNCIGALHNDTHQPEKRIENVSIEGLQWYQEQNLIPCAMIMHYLWALMSKESRSSIIHITAKVGSITDNRLGG